VRYDLSKKREFESVSQFIRRVNKEERIKAEKKAKFKDDVMAIVGGVVFTSIAILSLIIDSLW